MADSQCVACGDDFKRKSKGYERYGMSIQVDGQSIGSLLDQYSVQASSDQLSFVCASCYRKLKKIAKTEANFLTAVKRNLGPSFMVNWLVYCYCMLLIFSLFLFSEHGTSLQRRTKQTDTIIPCTPLIPWISAHSSLYTPLFHTQKN